MTYYTFFGWMNNYCPICFENISHYLDSHMQECYQKNVRCKICYETECNNKCKAIVELAEKMYGDDELERSHVVDLCDIPFERRTDLVPDLLRLLHDVELQRCWCCHETYKMASQVTCECDACGDKYVTYCGKCKIECHRCKLDKLCERCYKRHNQERDHGKYY